MVSSHSKSYGDYHEIMAGVLCIYTLPDSRKQTYYCRIKYPGQPYIRKSLKTSNRNEAIQRAQEAYYDTRGRQALNLPIGTYPFNHVVELYRKKRMDWTETEHWSSFDNLVDNYIKVFFEWNTDIIQLSDQDILNYWKWRRDYWKNNDSTVVSRRTGHPCTNVAINPVASTLERDMYALRAIFKWAANEGFIKRQPRVMMPKGVKGRSRYSTGRASFTLPQYEDVRSALTAMVSAELPDDATSNQRRVYKGVIRRARRLQCWILTIANTGIRPQELKKLRYCDVERWTSPYASDLGRVYICFHISEEVSKTGRPRIVYSRESGELSYNRIKWWRLYHTKFMNPEVDMQDDTTLIFPSERRGPGGKLVPVDIKPTMKNFLNSINLRVSPEGTRSSYSFRKFYASMRIQEGTSLHALSLNLGCSMQVLEYHYLRHQTLEVREQLTAHLRSEITKPDGRND